jgi:hypothetical protein
VELGLIGGSGAQVKVKVKSGAGGQNWPSVVRGKWRMRPKLPKSTCAFFPQCLESEGFNTHFWNVLDAHFSVYKNCFCYTTKYENHFKRLQIN